MGTFADVMTKLARVKRRRDLWSLLLEHFHAAGAARVSYHIVQPGQPSLTILNDGFPEDWINEYIAQRYIDIDPIPELAARLAAPFYWHDIAKLTPQSAQRDRYLAAMEAANIGDGLGFYVFGPGLHHAYVGLGFGPGLLDLPVETVFEHQCVAQAGHLRFCALNQSDPREALSERETEVLRWMALGKSNSVIAEVLSLSPHTIDAHVRSIYRKLRVADRTSAAIRGLGSGLLLPTHHVGTG